MKKIKTSQYIISLLPIILAASFIAGFVYVFDAVEPALAFGGDYALEFDGNTDFDLNDF